MKTAPGAASSSSLHPVLWVAGISLTLLPLVGIASLTGFLPTKSAPEPVKPTIVAAAPAIEPKAPVATASAAPDTTPQAPTVPASKALSANHQKTARRKVEQEIPAGPTVLPPPLGNTMEKSQHRTVSYQVTVRMEDGTTRLIDSDTVPPWHMGDKVKLVNGAIVSL